MYVTIQLIQVASSNAMLFDTAIFLLTLVNCSQDVINNYVRTCKQCVYICTKEGLVPVKICRPLNSHALRVRLTHLICHSHSPAKHIQISRRILLMCARRRGSARLGTSVVDPSMVALPTVYSPYVGDLKGAYRYHTRVLVYVAN